MSLKELIGRTAIRMLGMHEGSELASLAFDDGAEFRMWHAKDCCESVEIAEIHGDLDWLIGSPILLAEERVSDQSGGDGDSCTWTFYEIATNKGSVTIRWVGSSNGYYSETVSYEYTDARTMAFGEERAWEGLQKRGERVR